MPQIPFEVIMILMFVVFWWFFLRPKQKEIQKTEAMRKDLKKGDQVVTIGGIIASVHSVSDHSVILKADENVKLEVEKSAIARRIQNEEEKK